MRNVGSKNNVNPVYVVLPNPMYGAWEVGLYNPSVDISTIRGSRLPRGRALTNSEIAALIEVCINDPSSAGLRDAAMIAILVVGLRRAEVVAMNVSDFNPITGALIVRRGKGNQDRITYLPPGAKESVEDWLVISGT